MGRALSDILEMQFDLMYYLHMTIQDYDNNDAKDNTWLHSRLAQQKTEEIKAANKHKKEFE